MRTMFVSIAVGCATACGPKATSPAPAAHPTLEPAPAAPLADPVLSVEDCSAMFDHSIVLLADGQGVHEANAIHVLRTLNEKYRIYFVETCRARYTAADRDCIMHGTTNADFEACHVKEVDPADLSPDVSPPEPLACNRKNVDGPVIVTTSQYIARGGAGETSLPDLVTSKAKPLEACGYGPAVFAVADLTCLDGSHPFAKGNDNSGAVFNAIEAVRHNVGVGGRCNTIIDQYEVTCSEATYQVFVDAYFCLPGAWHEDD